jgi:PAS domain S-box-containing protein
VDGLAKRGLGGSSGRRARPRELLPLAVGALLGFIAAVALTLLATFDQWRREHESLTLAILVMSAVAGLLAIGGYSWHQYQVSRAEAMRRDVAERELAANNERSESLFEYHPHAVYSLDLEGRFTDMNSACERMTGFSRVDLLGMDSTVFSAPGDEEAARATLEDIAARRPRVFETSIRAKDGRALDLRITSVPIVAGDEVVGMYGIAEDVTSANNMRRELESARAAAEQASVAKTLFLANMSHELRTPLTSVLAASEMLRETDPAPEQSKLLDYIDRPGQRLLRLVEDLLDFSRIEAGNTAVDALELDLRTMVLEVGEDLRFTAERKELGFDCTVDPDVPSTMVGDLARISQVLTNLLENAIKFTDSGTVRLRVTNAPGSEASMVHFEVSDTGIGMTEEQLDGLFESFSQADPSMTRKYGGTGLGLAICKALVGLMGGSIGVTSVEGTGSTFSVLLPRGLPTPQDPQAEKSGQGPASGFETGSGGHPQPPIGLIDSKM